MTFWLEELLKTQCFKTHWDFFPHNLYNTANTTVLTLAPNNTVQGSYSSSKNQIP